MRSEKWELETRLLESFDRALQSWTVGRRDRNSNSVADPHYETTFWHRAICV